MTTICVSLTEMAADRLCDDDGQKTYISKIVKVNGDLIGVAGNAQDLHKFINFYLGEADDLEFEDSIAIVLKPDGIYTYESETPIKHDESHYSIGTGRAYALSMLDNGYSLEAAVKYACRRDMYSGLGKGGKVDILSLSDE